MRYKDENGKLVDYDPSLVAVDEAKSENGTSLDGYAYENAQGDMKHYIPEAVSEKTPLLLENGKYSLEVFPLFSDSSVQESSLKESGKQIDQTADFGPVQIENESVVDLYEKSEDKKTTASYDSGDDSFCLEYIPFESGVKENLILKEKPDTNVWRFAFTLGGNLTAKKNSASEGISFYTKDEKKILVGGIQAPYMNDATEKNYSESITYDLETVSEEDGSYILTMTVDSDYLNSENTEYPVTIDPSYTWTGSSAIYDVYVLSGSSYAGMNFYNSSTTGMFAGRTNANGYERTYISFDGLAEKVEGYSVASAKLTVYETGGGTSGETVQAHMVTAAWDKSTLTWNNKPSYSSTVLSSFVNTAKAYQSGVFDLTSYVRKIAKGTDDYGIMLRTKDEAVSKYAKFYGSRHSSTQYRPKLVVTYTDKPAEASSVSVASYWLKKNANVNVTWKGISSSALKSIQYRIALLSDDGKEFVNSEYAPYASNPVIGSAADGPAAIDTTALGEGCFRIYVRGVDEYGFAGPGKGATFVLDGTAPTLSSAGITTATTEAKPSNNAQPVITWSGASDKYLKQVQYSIDGGSYASMGTSASGSFTVPEGKISTAGKHTIKVRAVDKSGNASTVKTLYYCNSKKTQKWQL